MVLFQIFENRWVPPLITKKKTKQNRTVPPLITADSAFPIQPWWLNPYTDAILSEKWEWCQLKGRWRSYIEKKLEQSKWSRDGSTCMHGIAQYLYCKRRHNFQQVRRNCRSTYKWKENRTRNKRSTANHSIELEMYWLTNHGKKKKCLYNNWPDKWWHVFLN